MEGSIVMTKKLHRLRIYFEYAMVIFGGTYVLYQSIIIWYHMTFFWPVDIIKALWSMF